MWWQIQRLVKDPIASPLLFVKRVLDMKYEIYGDQQQVEEALQATLESRYTFAHIVPITFEVSILLLVIVF